MAYLCINKLKKGAVYMGKMGGSRCYVKIVDDQIVFSYTYCGIYVSIKDKDVDQLLLNDGWEEVRTAITLSKLGERLLMNPEVVFYLENQEIFEVFHEACEMTEIFKGVSRNVNSYNCVRFKDNVFLWGKRGWYENDTDFILIDVCKYRKLLFKTVEVSGCIE